MLSEEKKKNSNSERRKLITRSSYNVFAALSHQRKDPLWERAPLTWSVHLGSGRWAVLQPPMGSRRTSSPEHRCGFSDLINQSERRSASVTPATLQESRSPVRLLAAPPPPVLGALLGTCCRWLGVIRVSSKPWLGDFWLLYIHNGT